MFANEESEWAYEHDRTLEMWRRVEASLIADRLILECGGWPPGWETGDARQGFREDESGN